MISSAYPHIACHESLNLTFILSTSKLTNGHFKIKNEIDSQCFLPLVCARLCVQCLLCLRKNTSFN